MSSIRHKNIKFRALVGLGFGALLLLFVAWWYRDDLFQYRYDPGLPFQTYTPAKPPNYTDNEAWLRRPDVSVDPVDFEALGDVFIVAPTVFLGGSGWNADPMDADMQEQFERVVLPNYVLPFRSAGRLFAPYYRQASLYSFLNNRDDSKHAQVFAYEDVRRAFEAFLKHNPPERPIVLVGYGQGGLHAQRLLKDYFSGERAEKLAVAYILQHPMPIDALDDLSGITPCYSADTVNCVVAFGQFEPREGPAAHRFVSKTLVWDNTALSDVEGREILCVNPLLWTATPDFAPERLHIGGVAAEGLDDTTFPAPLPRQTSAQCMDGVLAIDQPKSKSLRRPHQFGGKYKTLRSNLFYEDLRLDSARRVQNLIDANVLPRRAPKLDSLEEIEIEDSPVKKAGPVKKRGEE